MHHTLVFHTITLGRKVYKSLGHKPFPHSMGATQASAILFISQYGTISQGKIATHLHIEPASMVTLIDELERLKLVRRQKIDGDRRRYQIALTPAGKKSVTGITEITERLDSYLRKHLSAKEVKYLLEVTEKLSTYLDKWKGGET